MNPAASLRAPAPRTLHPRPAPLLTPTKRRTLNRNLWLGRLNPDLNVIPPLSPQHLTMDMGPFSSGRPGSPSKTRAAPAPELLGSFAPPAPMQMQNNQGVWPAAPPPQQQQQEFSGPFMPPQQHQEFSGPFMSRPAPNPGRMTSPRREAPPPNYRGPLGAGLLQSLVRDDGERYGGGGSAVSFESSHSHSFAGCAPRPALRPQRPLTDYSLNLISDPVTI